MAERGAFADDEQISRIVMVNGSRQSFDRASGKLSVLTFDRYTLDLNLLRDAPGVKFREAQERFLDELFWPPPQLEPMLRRSFILEAHQRLLVPLSIFSFVLIPLACLLPGELNRRGQLRRVLLAVGIAFLFQAVDLGVKNLAGREYRSGPAPLCRGSIAAGARNRDLALRPSPLAHAAGGVGDRLTVSGTLRMPIARTLSGYIARQFLTWFGAVFGTIISIAFLLDYIELIRRSGSRDQATWGVLLEMAALKLPHTAQDVMPFAILFGTMLVFWRLTRSNELVAARAAGVSAWAFLAPALLMALLIGMVAVMLFNPVASAMQASYEKLENRILRLGRRSDQPVERCALAAPERWRRRSSNPSRRENRRSTIWCCAMSACFSWTAARSLPGGSRRNRPNSSADFGSLNKASASALGSRPNPLMRCGSPPV